MPEDSAGISQLSAPELKQWLDRGEPLVLLDVREDDERAYCALPAPAGLIDLHVPMGQLSARIGELRVAFETGPVVVYCHHGVRSLAVARWLAGQGISSVVNLQGGIDVWSFQVDPGVPRY